jgi:hypothetical protein
MGVNKIVIYIIIVLFLFGSLAFGIDKTESKKKTADTSMSVKSQETTAREAKKAELPEDRKSQQNEQSDYNDFVDENNNGLDDRVEGKTKKPLESSVEDKKATTDQNQADSTAKVK